MIEMKIKNKIKEKKKNKTKFNIYNFDILVFNNNILYQC